MPSTPRHAAKRTSLQTPTFWVDESGARGSAGKGYVVAALKTRHPDALARQIHGVREKYENWDGEFKFAKISERNRNRFLDLATVLEESDAHVIASVVQHEYNPFRTMPAWQAQAEIVSSLVVGGINRNEVAAVLMDVITTPAHVSIGHEVKRRVNARCRDQVVTTAVSLDSRANDLLQAADLIAGSIRHLRFAPPGTGPASISKQLVAQRLAAAMGVLDFGDQRSRRVNILTLSEPRSVSRNP